YVILIVDEYYIQGSSSYQKRRFLHPVLISGYNKLLRTFRVTRFINRVFNLNSIITFDEMSKAFYHDNQDSWFDCSLISIRQRNESVPLNLNLKKIIVWVEEYLNGNINNYIHEDSIYGINVYSSVDTFI